MGKRRAAAWTPQEIAILTEIYPAEGLHATADLLPERSWNAICVMAAKYGLRSPYRGQARKPELSGENLEKAIKLREEEGWPFARIGAAFGVCEASASNAILIALCPRKGYTPAPRTPGGALTKEGRDRLRLMLQLGLKGVDIQLRLGVSAACVAEQRRRYRADLEERGKAALPPPGNGKRYSGAKIPADLRKAAEALIMTGLGTPKVAARTGVSGTHCTRLRREIVRRLKRKGQAIPGCDINGRRLKVFEHSGAIPQSTIDALRVLLLDRVPVKRAAAQVGMGEVAAYKFRDALAAELAARGEQLPKPLRLGRSKAATTLAAEARWLPKGRHYIVRYRALCAEHGDIEGRRLMEAALAEERATAKAEARKPLTFEQQLARVAAGRAKIIPRFQPSTPDPAMTLGGIASAAL